MTRFPPTWMKWHWSQISQILGAASNTHSTVQCSNKRIATKFTCPVRVYPCSQTLSPRPDEKSGQGESLGTRLVTVVVYLITISWAWIINTDYNSITLQVRVIIAEKWQKLIMSWAGLNVPTPGTWQHMVSWVCTDSCQYDSTWSAECVLSWPVL